MPRRALRKAEVSPRARRTIEDFPRKLFLASARGRCQVCGVSKAVQAHHIVYDQELRRRGLSRWNTRNAMPVCKLCHEGHHSGSRRIPLGLLTDDQIAYAFEILGAFAYDYLKRRYSSVDQRLERELSALTGSLAR